MKFADTGWWVAWSLPGDTRHEDALAMLGGLKRSEQILTTNLVAGETWTLLRRKDSHRTALAFLDRLEALSNVERLVMHRVTEDQEAAAWVWLRKHDERVYSYVDATSFCVMRSAPARGAGFRPRLCRGGVSGGPGRLVGHRVLPDPTRVAGYGVGPPRPNRSARLIVTAAAAGRIPV